MDFKEYSLERIKLYKKLEKFELGNVTSKIIITNNTLSDIKKNFNKEIDFRISKKKRSRKENAEFRKMFLEKNKIFEPIVKANNSLVLYWFEIEKYNENIGENIISSINKIKKNEKEQKDMSSRWFTQALQKRTKNCKGCLYLGKVEKNLFSRFIQHLGLGYVHTGSLQLLHWFDLKNVEISFQFIEIENEYKNLIGDIELVKANEIQPLLGEIGNFKISDC